MGKSLHGFDPHGFIKRERVQARHAHQLRHAIHFRRARAALPCLAVPPNRKITGLFRLDLMNRVEDDHSRGNLGGVVLKFTLALLSPPDAKRCRRHYFISSITCRRSSRMTAIGSRVSCTSPSAPLRATIL